MKALSFDIRDIFRANRLAFSMQRILIQFIGTSLGYIGYLALTYASLIISGHSLSNMWKQMGVFPCLAGHDANFLSWILFGIGALFLVVVILITNTAVSRAVYMLVKGNYFYTWKEAFRFAIKKAGAVVFAPVAIIVLIGLFVAGGAFIGLLGKIPFAGEIGISLFYVVWILAGLLIVLFILVLGVSLLISPAVIATTDDDAFEAVFQSFSLVWSQPCRVIVYELLSGVLALAGMLIFAFFVKKAFLLVDVIFVGVIGDKYVNLVGQGMYMLQNWIGAMSTWIQSSLGDYTGLVYLENSFLQLELSSVLNISAVLFTVMMLALGVVVLSYGLATFQAATTLTYIVLRNIRENDNLLERKDREEEDDEQVEENSTSNDESSAKETTEEKSE
ncbi:hypothetical protein JW960_24610 [candidate division KSB1 bacterium]|nr:hypothetical protein [candidate division KSB1 bacterium]